MIAEYFTDPIEFWIQELKQYNFHQLCAKPSPNSWSLGQVYMHLLGETTYYLEQVNICASNNDHSTAEASPQAKIMFRNNCFPDEIIAGPPTNNNTPQPESKEQLISAFQSLKEEMRAARTLISTSVCKGKTQHPGLSYFCAEEWYQFIEMHLRHHLRQKRRIDDFLKLNHQ